MDFLHRYSFGGCLADDMGVGKTAQVLALLETRRELRCTGKPVAPSLVVVPKSLVFNWKQEAERFTPQLRVLDHTGMARDGNDFATYDVILTTYGTLRRDALSLKDSNSITSSSTRLRRSRMPTLNPPRQHACCVDDIVWG